MARRRNLIRLGLALLIVALCYPTFLFARSQLRSTSSRVDLPLLDRRDLDVPVHVALSGNFTASFAAVNGPANCLLGLPQSSLPDPCANTPETVQFHFRLLDQSANTVRGSYGIPIEGDFPDRQQQYQAFLGQAKSGVEFVILQPLRRGDYHLQLTHVRVPAGLLPAGPRLSFYEEGNLYEAIGALPLLLLSALLGLSGLILLIVATIKRPQSARIEQPR